MAIFPVFPTLFVSHGSPMWAVEPGIVAPALANLVKSWAKPRAVLVISAHWMSRTPQISTTSLPEVIYDFYGFPDVLYTLQYPAKGADATTVDDILAALAATDLQSVVNNTERGLDHGAWVPLRYLYPKADVPVMQLSLSPSTSPQAQYELGLCLQKLRYLGVLVIGSGSLTHNLREVNFSDGDDVAVAPYVEEFRSWMYTHLGKLAKYGADGLSELFQYRVLCPAGARAHPTVEHLMPLYVALGAAGEEKLTVQRIEGQTTGGVINMDAYVFGEYP